MVVDIGRHRGGSQVKNVISGASPYSLTPQELSSVPYASWPEAGELDFPECDCSACVSQWLGTVAARGRKIPGIWLPENAAKPPAAQGQSSKNGA